MATRNFSPRFITNHDPKASEHLLVPGDSKKMTTPTKIHIIGGPGSGKSYLAAQLSKNSGIEHIALDTIAYEDHLCVSPRSRNERLGMVSQYVTKPSWIAEGVYFSWIGKSLKHSDCILVLRTNKDCRSRNIVEKLKIQFHNNVDSMAYQEQLDRLMTSNLEYDKLFNERISGFIRPFAHKILSFDSVEEALKNSEFSKQ